MAYRLKRKRSVPKEFRRIVTEQLGTAVSELRASGTVSERSVHEARKSIKKIRAAIRLMRDELGSSYKDENRFLGDVGRSLSDLRDASVLVATLELLGTSTQSRETRACLKKLAAEFRTRQQQIANDQRSSAMVGDAARQLASLAKRVDDWPCSKRGFDGLRTGCKRTLQRTRDAFEQVQKSGTPQHLHDWRKRVKDHWYHVRLLSKLWPDMMTSFEGTLSDLETKLGDHHNLEILKQRIEALDKPSCRGPGRTAVLQLITNQQTRLAREATEIGERLYSVNADQEFRNIQQLWHTWRKR